MTRYALHLPFLFLLLAAGPALAQTSPDAFQSHLQAGQTALHANLPLAAVREYRAAARLRPADAEAHYTLAGVLEAAGRADEAEAEYRRTIALRPDNAPAHNALAGLLEDRGETQAALAQYRQAVVLLPADPHLRFNLAAALAASGQTALAAAQYREALRLKPDFAEAGRMLAALPVPAAVSGDKLALQRPASGDSLPSADLRPGLALARAGRLPEAEAAFQTVLSHYPHDDYARLHLGIVLYADGQAAPARREWRKVEVDGSKGAAAQARRLLTRYP